MYACAKAAYSDDVTLAWEPEGVGLRVDGSDWCDLDVGERVDKSSLRSSSKMVGQSIDAPTTTVKTSVMSIVTIWACLSLSRRTFRYLNSSQDDEFMDNPAQFLIMCPVFLVPCPNHSSRRIFWILESWNGHLVVVILFFVKMHGITADEHNYKWAISHGKSHTHLQLAV